MNAWTKQLDGLSERPELAAFREHFLSVVLIACVVLGAPTLAVIVPELVAAGDYGYALLHVTAYGACLGIATVGGRMPPQARAWTLVGAGHAAAIAGLLRVGPSGNALLVMLAFVTVASLLLGIRGSLLLLFTGLLALGVSVAGPELGWLHTEPLPSGPLRLGTTTLLFVLATVVVALGPLMLVTRLSAALRKEEERRALLEEAVQRHAEAERSRAQSEARFTELAELLPETIWEATPDGKLTYVNASAFRLSGFGPDDLAAGLHVFDLLAEREHERARENWRSTLAGESSGLTDYLVRRKDGSTIACLIRSAPIVQDGTVVGMRGVLVDDSERRQLEERVQGSQRMEALGALAGSVAHDFNNLLTAIQGHVALLSINERRDEQRDALHAIEGIIDQAARVTQRLLGLARARTAERQVIDLGPLVADTVEVFRRARPDHAIASTTPDFALEAEASGDEIQQVVLNLLTNACQATPPGGSVRVEVSRARLDTSDIQGSAARPGAFARITIADAGSGICPEHLPRIFEPFFTTKPRGQGTGLGLALAQRTVAAHAGLIQVESTLGSGTTFHVHVPLVESS